MGRNRELRSITFRSRSHVKQNQFGYCVDLHEENASSSDRCRAERGGRRRATRARSESDAIGFAKD